MVRFLRRLFAETVGAHIDGVRVIRRLPLLFSVVIGAELLQHVVETRIGLYRDAATAHARSLDGTRIAFGLVKMALFTGSSLFVIRRLVTDAGEARLAPLGTAALRYLPYLCYSMALVCMVLFAPALFGDRGASGARLVAGVVQLLLEPALVVWIVACATDGCVRTPLRSASLTGRLYPWALAVFVVGRIPSNAVHQLMARGAVGHDGAVLWIILVLDALSVGLIAAVIPALYVRIARVVRERATQADDRRAINAPIGADR